MRDWIEYHSIEIGLVALIAFLIGVMLWLSYNSFEQDKKEIAGCKSPALVNSVYGGKWVGVQYVYSCEGGNVIQVSNPINGAKVPR